MPSPSFDLASAVPATVAPSPQPAFDLASAVPVTRTKQASEPPSYLDRALAVLGQVTDYESHPVAAAENAAHIASAGVGGLAGGLGWLMSQAYRPGDNDAAEQVKNTIQGAMTYTPRTAGGQSLAQAADAAMAKIPQALDKAGGATTDAASRLGASPGVAAGLGTAVNVGGNALLNLLPMKGAIRGMVNPGEIADAFTYSRGAPSAPAAPPAAPPLAGRAPLPDGVLTPAQLRAQSIANGEAVGYQATPNYNPASSVADRWAQGIAGKSNVEQAARVDNQGVTNALAAKDVGLDPRQAITKVALNTIRDEASKSGYQPIEQLDGIIPADSQFRAGIAKIQAQNASPLSGNPDVLSTSQLLSRSYFDPSDILDQVRTLRSRAQDAFDQGRTSAGNGFKSQANELESLVDRHLQSADDIPDGMLQKFQAARQLIAKTHDIESSLNPSTGDIDAGAIGKLLADGGKLTGGLKVIADFANAAPGITDTPRGGPLPTSPLNTAAGVMAAHATHGASLALIPAIRMAAGKWLMRRNADPSLLAPAGKAFGENVVNAIHASPAAFAKFYTGPGTTAAVSTSSSNDNGSDQ